MKERYAVGMTIAGTVTRLADFGAFVELEPGLEGLVHVSELSNNRVRSPGDVVKIAQAVNVRVLEIDSEGRRISLSMREQSGSSKPVAPATPAAPALTPKQMEAKKKKRSELRGGLEF